MERGDTQVLYPGDPSERSKLQWNTASLLEIARESACVRGLSSGI